jgi:hypothetical protein
MRSSEEGMKTEDNEANEDQRNGLKSKGLVHPPPSFTLLPSVKAFFQRPSLPMKGS